MYNSSAVVFSAEETRLLKTEIQPACMSLTFL